MMPVHAGRPLTAGIPRIWIVEMLDIGQAVCHQLLAISRPCRTHSFEITGDFGHGVCIQLAAIVLQNSLKNLSHDNARTAIAAMQHSRGKESISSSNWRSQMPRR